MKVYTSVIIAALIVQSAQETAAECVTNCQDRLGRNSTDDLLIFNIDCDRGVQQSYVDCLASGGCLNIDNIETGIEQRYDICKSYFQQDSTSAIGKQVWRITCCYFNIPSWAPPVSCTDTCSLTSAATRPPPIAATSAATRPPPIAAMLGGAVAMLMLIL